MEAEHVDGAAFPANVERDLRDRIPAQGGEDAEDEFDQMSVLRVEEAIESFALPQQPNVNPRVDGCGHAHDRGNCDAIGMTMLDPAHGRLRRTRSTRQLTLGHPAATTERADSQAEANDVHS